MSSGANSPASSSTAEARAAPADGPDSKGEKGGLKAAWADGEVEAMKAELRAHGRNWTALAGKIGTKSADQCKKFFYENRKKCGLDKIILEYKRVSEPGERKFFHGWNHELFLLFQAKFPDQPPSLSTDEESGSSTSSCDEDQTTVNRQSRSNSPVIRNNGESMIQLPSNYPFIEIAKDDLPPPVTLFVCTTTHVRSNVMFTCAHLMLPIQLFPSSYQSLSENTRMHMCTVNTPPKT